METPELNNAAATIAAYAIASTVSEKVEDEDIVVVPEGFEVHDLEYYHPGPRRIRADVSVETLESFLSYYERFSNNQSVIFVNRQKGEITCIIDYHAPLSPEWCEHQIVYRMPSTPEWTAWKAKSGVPMTQSEFAQFIEDNAPDIVEPSAAEMLEVARNLQAKRKVEFKSSINEANGDVVLQYETETHAKGQIEVPAMFAIGMSVFQGGYPYRIEARLRYRISDDGQLTMWYVLIRPDKVREAALDDVVKVLRETTDPARLFFGSI